MARPGNPILYELGYDANDRVVIFHADDIGMCQATLPAFDDLLDAGLVASGSAMVPCPWFPAVAAWRAKHPSVDLGVHLTLTSEWAPYRWGPLSTCNWAAGLLDRAGYLPCRRETLWTHGDPHAVAIEMRAQLDRAEQMGLAPTHMDSHMYTALGAPFVADYIRLALERDVPAMLMWPALGWMDRHQTALAMQQLTQHGLPVFDHLVALGTSVPAVEHLPQTIQSLAGLPAGLTCWLIHPAQLTPELQAMAPDWRHRVADYTTFLEPALRREVRRLGIHVIDYQTLHADSRQRSRTTGNPPPPHPSVT